MSVFHVDENGATIRISEEGEKRRQIGLQFTVAQAIREYIAKAGIEGAPLF